MTKDELDKLKQKDKRHDQPTPEAQSDNAEPTEKGDGPTGQDVVALLVAADMSNGHATIGII